MKKILIILIILFFHVNNIYSEGNYDICVNDKLKLELVNLEDAEGIKGNFFLGCGTINNELYYIGYVKINNNIYKRVMINNSAEIHITNDEPYILIILVEGVRNDYNLEKMNIQDVLKNGQIQISLTERRMVNIQIYIPENSINNSFNLGE